MEIGPVSELAGSKKEFLGSSYEAQCRCLFTGFVTTLLHVYFQKVKPQAVAWVVKDGANGYFMKQITKGLPDARFIHIIRDGRAVLNSRMQSKMPYGKGETMSRDPLTSARLWKSFVKNIDSFKKLQPKRLIEIRYEDLVAHPDTQLVQLRRFLSLPEMGFKKEEDLGYYDRIASKEKNIHKLVAMPPQVNRADSWVRELPDGYRKVFEYAAGSTLKAKGYVDVGQYGLFDVLKNLATLKILISSTIKRIVGWFCYLLNPELLRKVLKQKIMAHIEKRL